MPQHISIRQQTNRHAPVHDDDVIDAEALHDVRRLAERPIGRNCPDGSFHYLFHAHGDTSTHTLGRFMWRSEDFAHATAVTAGTARWRVIHHLRDVSPIRATRGAQARDPTRTGIAPEGEESCRRSSREIIGVTSLTVSREVTTGG